MARGCQPMIGRRLKTTSWQDFFRYMDSVGLIPSGLSILMSGEFKGQGWQREFSTERSKPASSKTSSISVFFSNISCNCLFLLCILHSFVLFSNIFISPQVASGYIAGVTIQSKPEDHSSRFNMIPVSPSFFSQTFRWVQTARWICPRQIVQLICCMNIVTSLA